jgi:hypothetical protein
MTPNCVRQPDVWGAGTGRADVAVAVAGCEVCRLRPGCVDRYAAALKTTEVRHVTGLVLGGLHGRELLQAVQASRKAAA